MLPGLATAALVLGGLVFELSRPRLRAAVTRARVRGLELVRDADRAHELDYDPGRERRAEQRARELLRSCVNEREWAMYRDLGFLRVWGGSGDRYAYLIYPHKPIVAYVPQSGALLSEYCVAFPDHSRPYGSARLPDSDDVLAKWMALAADERRLIADANMHLPGRQVDPRRVEHDLARLSSWEREHEGVSAPGRAGASASGSVSVSERAGAPGSQILGGADGMRAGRGGLDGWDPDNVRAA